ncbi:DUF1249 domain-containing protein [Thermomonas sp.]
MSVSLVRRVPVPRISRFGWLMGLYAENHSRMQRLFEPADLACGAYASSIGDGLDLQLEVIERHAYTVELRLSYGLVDPQTGLSDPSASLRLYRDARQVEATHCYAGRRWQDVIGMYPPPKLILDHRLRMNTFLGKWLEYLAEQGHGVATLRPSAQRTKENGPHRCDP